MYSTFYYHHLKHGLYCSLTPLGTSIPLAISLYNHFFPPFQLSYPWRFSFSIISFPSLLSLHAFMASHCAFILFTPKLSYPFIIFGSFIPLWKRVCTHVHSNLSVPLQYPFNTLQLVQRINRVRTWHLCITVTQHTTIIWLTYNSFLLFLLLRWDILKYEE